jgi:integrase/recombinase XerD
VLEYAIDQGWRQDNPALPRLKRLKERRDPIILPEPDDIRAVIARAPGNFARLIEAAWRTGCRQSELLTALRAGLDHTRRQLTVVGKRNKLRVIQLDDDAYEALSRIPAALATKYLFWHSDGEPYRNVASRFAALVGSAQNLAQREGREFRPFRFHDLRHRFAVDWLKSGRSIYDLKDHLGHESVKTTEVYLRYLTPGETRAAKLTPA